MLSIASVPPPLSPERGQKQLPLPRLLPVTHVLGYELPVFETTDHYRTPSRAAATWETSIAIKILSPHIDILALVCANTAGRLTLSNVLT